MAEGGAAFSVEAHWEDPTTIGRGRGGAGTLHLRVLFINFKKSFVIFILRKH